MLTHTIPHYQHSTLNIDVNKPHAYNTIHTIYHLPSAVYTGIHLRTLLQSARCRKVRICPLKLVTVTDCSQVGEDEEHSDELPWDDFWQSVHKFFGLVNQVLHLLFRWLVSDDLTGEEARSYSWKWHRRQIVAVKLTLSSRATSSGGRSYSQHANCTLP